VLEKKYTDMVSVIMPCFNCSMYMIESIESVISQTYVHWELIVVDDGSIDNSVEIIKSFQANIHLLQFKKNRGVAIARNEALSFANGRFIAFLDCDDIWLPEKLERQIQFMMHKKAHISFTSYGVISKNSKKNPLIVKSVDQLNVNQYLKNTAIGLSTSMIDTRYTGRDFRFRNLRMRQDASLWIDLLGAGHVAYGIPSVLSYYRVRPSSLSGNPVKAAIKTWNLFYHVHKLGVKMSVYYYYFYMKNSLKRRRLRFKKMF
jgi:teichuronic acid biosynthesis glycosyltransferase TuaG